MVQLKHCDIIWCLCLRGGHWECGAVDWGTKSKKRVKNPWIFFCKLGEKTNKKHFLSFNKTQDWAPHLKNQAHSCFSRRVNSSLILLHLCPRCSKRMPLTHHMKRRGTEYCHVMSKSSQWADADVASSATERAPLTVWQGQFSTRNT